MQREVFQLLALNNCGSSDFRKRPRAFELRGYRHVNKAFSVPWKGDLEKCRRGNVTDELCIYHHVGVQRSQSDAFCAVASIDEQYQKNPA